MESTKNLLQLLVLRLSYYKKLAEITMIQNLHAIQKKIDDIGLGLLRSRENKLPVSIQIRVRCDKDNLIHCYASETTDLLQLKNKTVSLLQKSDDDYLYVTGRAQTPAKNDSVLPIRIFKACWLVRKRKGSVTWFQEKHTYDILPQ